MSETSAPTTASFLPRITKHTAPIIAVAIGLFAFHWQSLRGEETCLRERSEVRSRTLTDTAGLALSGAMLRKDAVDVMILVEGLVRENPDVLSVRVGGKDGKSIAETEAEHIDEADSRSARVLTQPILVKDTSGTSKAIGTIDMRISTKEVEQLASANMTASMIEGGLCLAFCCGMIFLMKRYGSSSSPAAKRIANSAATKMSIAKSAVPAKPSQRREIPKKEPRAPQPSKASSHDDEPVEVSLNSPPPSGMT